MRAEWENERLHVDVSGFEEWKRACAVWEQAGWVYKRVALAVASKVGHPQSATAKPSLAMSLDRPLTIEEA